MANNLKTLNLLEAYKFISPQIHLVKTDLALVNRIHTQTHMHHTHTHKHVHTHTSTHTHTFYVTNHTQIQSFMRQVVYSQMSSYTECIFPDLLVVNYLEMVGQALMALLISLCHVYQAYMP